MAGGAVQSVLGEVGGAKRKGDVVSVYLKQTFAWI